MSSAAALPSVPRFLEKSREGAKRSLLIVGLDTDPKQIPQTILDAASRSTTNGEDALEEAVFRFNEQIVEDTTEDSQGYKPNLGYYEALGEPGYRGLRRTLDLLALPPYAHQMRIADGKRGDVIPTLNQYAAAIYGLLQFDCMTVNGWMGGELNAAALTAWPNNGSIMLCKTSNEDSGTYQDRLILLNSDEYFELKGSAIAELITMYGGLPFLTFYQYTAWQVSKLNKKYGVFALVVGATYPLQLREIRVIDPEIPILLPGVGAQKGFLEDCVRFGVNKDKGGLWVVSARGIIYAKNPREAAKRTHSAIEEVRAGL